MADQVLGNLVWRITGDSTDFDKKLTGASKKLNAFGKKSVKVGKDMTKFITLPLVGLGAAAVKVAADFEVISRKFNTAFAGSIDEANAAVKNLNENFGISSSLATEITANTGDLLKGFGATAEQALSTSEQVQELAAALGAYNGVDVKSASENITKALLGETEGMKSLGVAIKQADVEKQLLIDGTSELTGQELLLAKAQATLTLAYQQSGDAVASFADNQGTVAFQTQKVLGDIKDLGVQFGTILLPIVSDIIEKISEAVKWFSDLDEETKKTILIMAGLAAAAGPVVMAIGNISKAMSFLAANPAAAVITALAGVVAGGLAIGNLAHEKTVQKWVEQYSALGEQLGIANENIGEFARNAGAINELTFDFGGGGLFVKLLTSGKMAGYVQQLADEYGYTNEQIIEILKSNEDLTDQAREQLDVVQEELTWLDSITASAKAQGNEFDELREKAEARTQAAEATAEAESEITLSLQDQIDLIKEQATLQGDDVILKRVSLYYDEYLPAIRDANNLFKAGLIDEIEYTKQLLDAENAYNEGLAKTGLTAQSSFNGHIEKAQELEKRYKALTEGSAELSETVNTVQKRAIQDTFEYQKWIIEEEDRLRQLRVEKEREAAEAIKQLRIDSLTAVLDTYNTISGLISSIASQTTENIRSEFDNWQKINGDELAGLEAKAAKDEELTAEELARLQELRAEEKKLKKEQYAQELEAFKTNKTLSIANAIIAGAQAAINAYNSLSIIPVVGPALGAAAAVAVGALAAKQVALIAAQQPPAPPKFADGVEGFMVPPGYPNDSFPIMVQSGERVTVETPAQQAGNKNNTFNIYNNLYTGSQADMERLARHLAPYLEKERIRNG